MPSRSDRYDLPGKVWYVRQKLYLSQQSLADAIGVSFLTVNRWKNDKYKPNLMLESKFMAFCSANGIVFEDKEDNAL